MSIQHDITGLYVGGTIQERHRRYINCDNNERIEGVTYTIIDNLDKRYYVEDYAPSSYREIGTSLLEPVYVKPHKKTGDLPYTICIKMNINSSRGEAFMWCPPSTLSFWTDRPILDL